MADKISALIFSRWLPDAEKPRASKMFPSRYVSAYLPLAFHYALLLLNRC